MFAISGRRDCQIWPDLTRVVSGHFGSKVVAVFGPASRSWSPAHIPRLILSQFVPVFLQNHHASRVFRLFCSFQLSSFFSRILSNLHMKKFAYDVGPNTGKPDYRNAPIHPEILKALILEYPNAPTPRKNCLQRLLLHLPSGHKLTTRRARR